MNDITPPRSKNIKDQICEILEDVRYNGDNLEIYKINQLFSQNSSSIGSYNCSDIIFEKIKNKLGKPITTYSETTYKYKNIVLKNKGQDLCAYRVTHEKIIMDDTLMFIVTKNVLLDPENEVPILATYDETINASVDEFIIRNIKINLTTTRNNLKYVHAYTTINNSNTSNIIKDISALVAIFFN
jgi:hypothetical protein